MQCALTDAERVNAILALKALEEKKIGVAKKVARVSETMAMMITASEQALREIKLDVRLLYNADTALCKCTKVFFRLKKWFSQDTLVKFLRDFPDVFLKLKSAVDAIDNALMVCVFVLMQKRSQMRRKQKYLRKLNTCKDAVSVSSLFKQICGGSVC